MNRFLFSGEKKEKDLKSGDDSKDGYSDASSMYSSSHFRSFFK